MAYFEWSSEIELGHPLIDDQHKQLLILAEAVVHPLLNSKQHQPGADELQALIDYAQAHFAMEEGLMRDAGYLDLAMHANQHVSLLTELRTYCSRIRHGQNTNPVGLVAFLRNWIVLHVDTADRQLVVWLKSREAAGKT
jgi:hemerythrin-like metal-binding protein